MQSLSKKVLILGAGNMGMSISAHFANIGIESFLLDIDPSIEIGFASETQSPMMRSQKLSNRVDRIAKSLLESSPANLYIPENINLINVLDASELPSVVEAADWIIEAVTEKYEVKKNLLQQVQKHRKPGTIISSTSSSISINALASILPTECRHHFLGTHFFKPVRYRRLLEIIPCTDTLPEVLDDVMEFTHKMLGKGVVVAKDSPYFIAARIAAYDILAALYAAEEEGMTVEEVDTIMGPAMGRPESAVFHTADMLGLDAVVSVLQSILLSHSNGKQEFFFPPDFVAGMIEKNWIGDKTGQGFYCHPSEKVDKTLFLDFKTMQYYPLQKPWFPSIGITQLIPDIPNRIKTLISITDRVGQFVWKMLKKTLLFSAGGLQEIADDLVSIDRALKWGYNWELGPFEIWDSIGLNDSVRRMEKEGDCIPPWIEELLSSGRKSFYSGSRTNGILFYDLKTSDSKQLPDTPGTLFLSDRYINNYLVRTNDSANLLDIGDDVVCLEFASDHNAFDDALIDMIWQSVEELEKRFVGLVIGNQGVDFSMGLNLLELMKHAEENNWDVLERHLHNFQNALSVLKYCRKPVIVAPFQRTLMAACEMVLSASQVQAAAETYMGLTEIHFGLLPVGGGIKELLVRSQKQTPALEKKNATEKTVIPCSLRHMFKNLVSARLSNNAQDARKSGFLKDEDQITYNPDRLIFEAKQAVIKKVEDGFFPPEKCVIKVTGTDGYNELINVAADLGKSGEINDYDLYVADKLAKVITGGDVTHGTVVREQHILDLQRENFLLLLGEERTRHRIQYMFKTEALIRS